MILIIIGCLVYSFAYTGRYSYNANISPIMAFYSVTRAEASLAGTCFFFAYGVGQLNHAIFCKYYPRKYVIPAVLGVSAVLNLIVFCGVPVAAIKYLWLINGLRQSVLWPVLVLVLSDTMDFDMMKRAMFAMSLTVVIGIAISYGGSALFNLFDFFQGAFLMGAALMVLIGLVWMIGYDTLTAHGVCKGDAEPVQTEKRNSRKTDKALIGLIAVCALFIALENLIKDWLNTASGSRLFLVSSVRLRALFTVGTRVRGKNALCSKQNDHKGWYNKNGTDLKLPAWRYVRSLLSERAEPSGAVPLAERKGSRFFYRKKSGCGGKFFPCAFAAFKGQPGVLFKQLPAQRNAFRSAVSRSARHGRWVPDNDCHHGGSGRRIRHPALSDLGAWGCRAFRLYGIL